MTDAATDAQLEKPYHHGNLRAALVDAGVQLAGESGPGGIVLREAARRVGVSHNAGYRHFSNRDELVAAVAEEGMARLASAMTTALAAVPPAGATNSAVVARLRLRAIGQAYVSFALAEPGLFRTAFASCETPAQVPSLDRPGPYQILSEVVDGFVTAGIMHPRDRAYSEITAWSAVHGLSALVLDGPLRPLPEEQIRLALDRLCSVVESGLHT